MNNELALRPGLALARPMSAAEFNTAMEIARVMAASGMFPGVADAAKAFVKMEQGKELGLGPVTALREIHIIEGKAALSSNLIAALIQASGHFSYRVITKTAQECRIAFYEAGEKLGESVVTMEAMRKVTKGNSTALLVDGVNWKNYPDAMLFARAISSGARTYCPAIFLGGVYVADELTGEAEPQGEYIEGEAEEVQPVAYDPPLADVQKTQLNTLMRRMKGPDKDALLAPYHAANISELTESQAAALIATLQQPMAPAQAPVVADPPAA